MKNYIPYSKENSVLLTDMFIELALLRELCIEIITIESDFPLTVRDVHSILYRTNELNTLNTTGVIWAHNLGQPKGRLGYIFNTMCSGNRGGVSLITGIHQYFETSSNMNKFDAILKNHGYTKREI